MRAAIDSAGTLEGRLITVTGFTMKGAAGADLARWSSSAAPPMHIGAAAPHRSSCHDRRSLSRGHLAARRRQRGHRIVATLNIVHSDDDSNQRDADRAARQHLHLLVLRRRTRNHNQDRRRPVARSLSSDRRWCGRISLSHRNHQRHRDRDRHLAGVQPRNATIDPTGTRGFPLLRPVVVNSRMLRFNRPHRNAHAASQSIRPAMNGRDDMLDCPNPEGARTERADHCNVLPSAAPGGGKPAVTQGQCPLRKVSRILGCRHRLPASANSPLTPKLRQLPATPAAALCARRRVDRRRLPRRAGPGRRSCWRIRGRDGRWGSSARGSGTFALPVPARSPHPAPQFAGERSRATPGRERPGRRPRCPGSPSRWAILINASPRSSSDPYIRHPARLAGGHTNPRSS
jgi:hypothetical protein